MKLLSAPGPPKDICWVHTAVYKVLHPPARASRSGRARAALPCHSRRAPPAPRRPLPSRAPPTAPSAAAPPASLYKIQTATARRSTLCGCRMSARWHAPPPSY